MSTELRRGMPADAEVCGRICFEAFKALADRHSFPQDFPSPEVAAGLLSMLLTHPGFHGVVATRDGRSLVVIFWMSAHQSWGSARSPSIQRHNNKGLADF
jgi:hypothetical protein